MVILPPRPQGHPIWRSPLFEWGVLAVLVCVVVVSVWGEARKVQELAERAAVQTMLGALRTAYVTDFLRQQAQGRSASIKTSATEANPFLLLEHPAANYAGLFSAEDVAQVRQGNWMFDPACPCIGYRPLYTGDLQPAMELPVLWFRISATSGARQLEPRTDYLWGGALIR